jgi:hypothetical protein
MPNSAVAEFPSAYYEQLGPNVHDAVDRILDQRDDGSFRVDHIDAGEVDVIRNVLRRSIGMRLPDYRYDEAENYVQMGRTVPVEERHSQVMVLDRGERQDDSLWLRVPRYSDPKLVAREAHGTSESFTKKDLVIFGAGGLLVNAMILKGGLHPNNHSLMEAGGVIDIPLIGYLLYRATRVLGPLQVPSR